MVFTFLPQISQVLPPNPLWPTAGYLTYAIYAVRLIPNSRTAGYLLVYTNKNPAIVYNAIAGYLGIRVRI